MAMLDRHPPIMNGHAAELAKLTRIVIPSAARTIDGARPELKLKVFTLQARELLGYARRGVVDKADIVDFLQGMAETSGLVENHGQDEIQAVMADAVDEPAPATRSAAEEAAK